MHSEAKTLMAQEAAAREAEESAAAETAREALMVQVFDKMRKEGEEKRRSVAGLAQRLGDRPKPPRGSDEETHYWPLAQKLHTSIPEIRVSTLWELVKENDGDEDATARMAFALLEEGQGSPSEGSTADVESWSADTTTTWPKLELDALD